MVSPASAAASWARSEPVPWSLSLVTVRVLRRARVSSASRSGLNVWRGRLRPLPPTTDDETGGRTENERDFAVDIDWIAPCRVVTVGNVNPSADRRHVAARTTNE